MRASRPHPGEAARGRYSTCYYLVNGYCTSPDVIGGAIECPDRTAGMEEDSAERGREKVFGASAYAARPRSHVRCSALHHCSSTSYVPDLSAYYYRNRSRPAVDRQQCERTPVCNAPISGDTRPRPLVSTDDPRRHNRQVVVKSSIYDRAHVSQSQSPLCTRYDNDDDDSRYHYHESQSIQSTQST